MIYIVRKSNDYSIVVKAASEDEAREKAETIPDEQWDINHGGLEIEEEE